MGDVIARLVPGSVATAEVFGDPAGLSLHPAEQACIAGAVASRRAEFRTGRYCARTALACLGAAPTAILRGPSGEPLWPAGVIGSITHCAGYRAAAVAHDTDLAGIGIDAERNAPLAADMVELISLPRERVMLAGLAAVRPDVAWDRLLFSAKESVYKACFPLTGETLGFRSADVTFDAAGGSLAARLVAPASVTSEQVHRLTGRFAVRHGIVLAVVVRDLARHSGAA